MGIKLSDSDWKEEWKDMPEFIQEQQRPYSAIIVRFATEKDLNEFATLIEQKLNQKTKSIWYPFRSHWGNGTGKKYRDES